jgi:photosystem II stability/assembly factor-like uncharacterized protein
MRQRTRSIIAGFITVCSLQAQTNLTCANPPFRATPAGTLAVLDKPAARANWFLDGRKPPTPSGGVAAAQPAARAAGQLLRSFQQASQLRPRRGLAAAPPAWNPAGPAPQRSLYWGNVSGRVTSLAVDQRNGGNVLYVGTAFGGLWRTNDFTAAHPTFTPIGDRIWPSLAVGSIALDLSGAATKPAVIYVGTGEVNLGLDSYYGIGILKSSDGGSTWSLTTGKNLVPVTSPAQYELDGPFVGTGVSKILIDPNNPKHILAAFSTSGLAAGRPRTFAIYESMDAAASWKRMELNGAGPAGYFCTDLVYEPSQDTFYAAVLGGGVYRWSRGDTAWSGTSSPFGSIPPDTQRFYRASLAARAGTVYAVISAGDFGENDHRSFDLSRPGGNDTGIVQSTDKGARWTPVPAPPRLFNEGRGQGFYNQWIAAPAASQSLLAGGISIWRTGSTANPEWLDVGRVYDYEGGRAHPERHIHPDQHAVVILGERSWIVGNDGGVWRTVDGGETWIDLNTDIDTIQFVSATPLQGAAGFLGGSQDNGTAVSDGAGRPWSTVLTGDGGHTSGNPLKPSQYFTERFYVSLCRSEDSGQNWTTVVDGGTIGGRAPFYVPYRLINGNPDQIILGTDRLWIGPAAPATPGAGWRPISNELTGLVQAIAFAPSAPRSVYFTTTDSQVWFNPDVYATTPGPRWSPIRTNTLPKDRVFSSIAVDPQDARVAYVGVQGFGTGHVYRTDSAGGRWVNVTPWVRLNGRRVDIDSPVNSIAVDPQYPAEVYVATDMGVFVSSDRGANWQAHGANLPRTAVVELKFSADRTIVAATHGRGVWTIAPIEHGAPAGGRR